MILLMVHIMKVNFKMTAFMDLVKKFIRMEEFMKENGVMISIMDLEKNLSQMSNDTKVILKMI